MRALIAIAAASAILVGCESLGSSTGSSASSEPGDCPNPQTVVTKTGVVETC